MPDAIGAAANTGSNAFSIGANAQARKEAELARTTTKLTEEEKERLLLQKVNEGQKLDKPPVTAENQGKLGKDDFMKLMIATLKYQDPSSPMDTQKLLEQTSVMTNMEQMIKMTEASQKAFEAQQRVQGSNLVGKTVVYDATDKDGNLYTTAAKVDAVEFLAKGEVLLHVGGQKLKMDKVLGVADPDEDVSDLTNSSKTEADKTKTDAKAEETAAAGATKPAANPKTTPEDSDDSAAASASEPAAASGTPAGNTGETETGATLASVFAAARNAASNINWQEASTRAVRSATEVGA